MGLVVLNLNPRPFKTRKGAAPKCRLGVEVEDGA